MLLFLYITVLAFKYTVQSSVACMQMSTTLSEDVCLFFDAVRSLAVSLDSHIVLPPIPQASAVRVYAPDLSRVVCSLGVSGGWPDLVALNATTGDLVLASEDRATLEIQTPQYACSGGATVGDDAAKANREHTAHDYHVGMLTSSNT